MNTETLRAFVTIADASSDATVTFSGDSRIAGLLAEAQEAQLIKAEAAIKDDLIGLVESIQSTRDAITRRVTEIKRELASAEEALTVFDTAQAFGAKTGNYLPLLCTVGIVDLGRAPELGLTVEELEVLATIPQD